MSFNELLREYEEKILYIERMTQASALSFYHKDESFWDGYKRATFDWFQTMKMYCDDVFPELEMPTDGDKEKMKDPENGNPPVNILNYRDERIPVYFDDDGQQLYAIYHGKEIPGGAFCASPEDDFCYAVDEILLFGDDEKPQGGC